MNKNLHAKILEAKEYFANRQEWNDRWDTVDFSKNYCLWDVATRSSIDVEDNGTIIIDNTLFHLFKKVIEDLYPGMHFTKNCDRDWDYDQIEKIFKYSFTLCR